VKVTPLTPVFAARIDGVDLTRPLPDATFAEIRAAFEERPAKAAALSQPIRIEPERGAIRVTLDMHVPRLLSVCAE
jgi:hypothetical protein